MERRKTNTKCGKKLAMEEKIDKINKATKQRKGIRDRMIHKGNKNNNSSTKKWTNKEGKGLKSEE